MKRDTLAFTAKTLDSKRCLIDNPLLSFLGGTMKTSTGGDSSHRPQKGAKRRSRQNALPAITESLSAANCSLSRRNVRLRLP